LLFALGDLEPCGSKFINFYVTDMTPHFPYHVAFQIHVDYSNYTIKHTIIDEGIATCVMSLTCWKSIGSPNLSQSLTMLTTFEGPVLTIKIHNEEFHHKVLIQALLFKLC
jgi:hypothetical protein